MMSSWTRAGAFASMAALLLTASPSVAAEAPPYELNVVLSETGAAGFAGQAEAAALRGLEKVTNASGGINGRPLEMVFHDDQSSPQVTVQIVNDLIAKKVPAFIGPTLVAMCSAIAPLVQNGPFGYCMSASLYPPTGSFQFATNPSTVDWVNALITYYRRQNLHRIAVLTTTDASGQDGDKQIAHALAEPENHSMTVVATEHYGISDLSVSAQIAHLKAATPDAYIVWSAGTPTLTAMRGFHDAGLDDAPIGLSPANASYLQLKQMGPIGLKKMIFPSVGVLAPDAIRNPTQRRAIQQLIDASAPARPDLLSVTGWDPGSVLVDALRHFGPSATAEQLRSYVANLRGFVATNGTYDFQAIPQRGVGEADVFISIWDNSKGTWVGVSGPSGTPPAGR